MTEYFYSKLKRKKIYKGSVDIDFEQNGSFLVYVSEIDELKQQVEKSSKSINKNLEKIEAKIIQYCNIEDAHLKTIIEDYKKED